MRRRRTGTVAESPRRLNDLNRQGYAVRALAEKTHKDSVGADRPRAPQNPSGKTGSSEPPETGPPGSTLSGSNLKRDEVANRREPWQPNRVVSRPASRRKHFDQSRAFRPSGAFRAPGRREAAHCACRFD